MQTIFYLRTVFFAIALFPTMLPLRAQSPFITPSQHIITTAIQLSVKRTTVIVFPAPIAKNGVDRGNELILAKTVDGISNVVKLRADSATLPPSNLTIFTSDGRVYRFEVEYNDQPNKDFYDFFERPAAAASNGVQFNNERMNDATILKATHFVGQLPAHRSRPRSKTSGQVKLQTLGVFISHGVLFFHLGISNASGVPYTVDFFRCYQKDRRKSKRTSQMEKEVAALATNYHTPPVIGTGIRQYSVVLAFEQFTIAESKYFMIELFEKGGDRHLSLRIKGDDILKAKSLLIGH